MSRYDGNEFITIDTKSGLSSDILTSIAEDQQGNIWIGTHGGGVNCIISEGRDSAMNFMIRKFNSSHGLIHDVVYSVLTARDGKIWFGTLEGTSVYDGSSFTTFDLGNEVQSKNINAICEDEKKHLSIKTVYTTAFRTKPQIPI